MRRSRSPQHDPAPPLVAATPSIPEHKRHRGPPSSLPVTVNLGRRLKYCCALRPIAMIWTSQPSSVRVL
eukprot:55956-Chlamydomonas_euryale.AAC.1